MSDAYAVKRYSRAQFGERLVRELLELDDCSPTQWRGGGGRGGHMLRVCVFMLIAVPSPRVPCGCFLLCCHHPGAETVLRPQQNFSSSFKSKDEGEQTKIPSAPPAHHHNLNLSPRAWSSVSARWAHMLHDSSLGCPAWTGLCSWWNPSVFFLSVCINMELLFVCEKMSL